METAALMPRQEHGPLRLGECHQDGWRDQPGFPCYKWLWFEEDQSLPTIRCVCGGSYPRPPPGLSKDISDMVLADPLYANNLVGQAAVNERDLPDTKTNIARMAVVPTSTPIITRVGTRKWDAMEMGSPSTFTKTVTLPPVWPTQSMIRRDGIEVNDRSDYGGLAFIIAGIFVFVASILGINYAIKRSRRTDIERRRHTII